MIMRAGLTETIDMTKKEKSYPKIIEFEFEQGNLPFHAARVILLKDKKTIEYSATPFPDKYTHVPSNKDWKIFSYTLDKLRVEDWYRPYEEDDIDDRLILDPPHWHLLIRTTSSLIQTGSALNYPLGFNLFIESINKLINKNFFDIDIEFEEAPWRGPMKLLAEQGDTDAQFDLGMMYLELDELVDDEVPKENLKIAKYWLDLARKNGHDGAKDWWEDREYWDKLKN
jgi:hypothetical protein